MAASAQMKDVLVSPATSNDVKFERQFGQMFRTSSLHDAFRTHPAFNAVFEDERMRQFSRRSTEKKFPGKIVALSGDSAAKAATADRVQARVSEGLISSIMTAYNSHCELVISADDVWLTILSQFCAYVNKNAEGLRNRIVEHEGKKTLIAYSNGSLLTADYPRMIRDLLGQIRQNIKSPELADWFRPGFSTTTERDEVCAAATAMASLQAYFEFMICCRCGIPSVTLKGTVEDWKLLREKIERLLDFEVEGNPEGKVMELWVGYLRKVCDGFVESAERPDSAETLEFWDKVLSHERGGSGMPSFVTGWVSAFTCFNKDGDFVGKRKPEGADFPKIYESEICHNVVSCPVIIDDNGVRHDGTLFSGQVVCEVERAGERGYPVIHPRNDWCLSVAVKWAT